MKITKEQFDNLPYDLKKNFIHRKIKRRPLDNIVETGAGALNIDGGRIPTQDEYVINRFTDGAKPFGNGAGHEYESTKVRPSRKHKGKVYDGVADGYKRPNASMYQHKTDWEMQEGGRWPANFILDTSSAELLDKQTGILTSGKPSGKKKASNKIYGQYKNENIDVTGIGDSGGASRFFYNVQEQINEADPIYYCGKVGKVERNAGLDDEPEKELGHSKYDKCSNCGGYIFQSEGRNSKCLCENPIRVSNTQKNNHPTMKPIALAKYLATLLLPPDGYAPRRILVPFSGVGSEMIGAMQAGWEQIVGIEFDTENGYVDMAHKRMEYWSNKK